MASSSILTVAWRRYLQQLDKRPLRTKARQPAWGSAWAWMAVARGFEVLPGCTGLRATVRL